MLSRNLLIILTFFVCISSSQAQSLKKWEASNTSRMQAQSLLTSFNAALLDNPSASVVLRSWCNVYGFARPATLTALLHRDNHDAAPESVIQALSISKDEVINYRAVKLVCGKRVLSIAQNWYVPSRLTTSMNHELETSDTPFGFVVRPLNFTRVNLANKQVWFPMSEDIGSASVTSPTPNSQKEHDMNQYVLMHKAILNGKDNKPISFVSENYTPKLFDIKHIDSSKSILNEILTHGVLRVGFAGNTLHKSEGDIVVNSADKRLKLNSEMMEFLAKSLGVKLEIVPTTASHIKLDLLSRKFDIAMAGMGAATSPQKSNAKDDDLFNVYLLNKIDKAKFQFNLIQGSYLMIKDTAWNEWVNNWLNLAILDGSFERRIKSS